MRPMDLAIYTEPRFWWFPISASLVSMGAFLLFAVPFTILATRDPAWARGWRIQDKPFHVERFLWPSIRRWLVNNAAMTVGVIASWPLLRLSHVHDGPLPAWWVWVGSLSLFVLLDDALYYFMHRAMHRGWLWRVVHSDHHKVVTPFAFTGHHMHPLEYVATGSLMLVGPLLLGSHIGVVYAWIVLRQWEASEGHSGYRLPLSPTVWLPGSGGPDHHDFHHSRFHGNYAGYLPHMDRLLGTLSKGYAEHAAARRARSHR